MPLTNVKIALNTQVLACSATNNYANVIYLQGYVDHEPKLKKDVWGAEYMVLYVVTRTRATEKYKIRVRIEGAKLKELKELQKTEELKHKFVTVQGELSMITTRKNRSSPRLGQVNVFSRKYHSVSFQHDPEDDLGF